MYNRTETLSEWKWYSLSGTNVDLVPQAKGVYALGRDSNVLYYGKSQNLRSRLRQHLTTTDPCLKRANQFAYRLAGNPDAAEEELLASHYRQHGKYPPCNDQGS